MQLKYKFVIQKVADTYMAVPVGKNASKTNSILKLNATAAFIVEQLGKETTEEQIVDALLKEYEGVERETAAKDVHAMVELLREKDLLA